MALAAGTRLGPYEIAAQIGVGGMGEVYRATDTTLNRQVAIKVLPESLAAVLMKEPDEGKNQASHKEWPRRRDRVTGVRGRYGLPCV
jgi:serine/threonine protein kinase